MCWRGGSLPHAAPAPPQDISRLQRYSPALIRAIYDQRLSMVRKLLANGADPDHIQPSTGPWGAPHWAASAHLKERAGVCHQVLPLPCPTPSAPQTRNALEGRGPQRRPQRRLGRRLEEVAKAVGGGYCRLQMPSRLALAVRGTVAGHRLDALEEGYLPPFQCIPPQTSPHRTAHRHSTHCSASHTHGTPAVPGRGLAATVTCTGGGWGDPEGKTKFVYLKSTSNFGPL